MNSNQINSNNSIQIIQFKSNEFKSNEFNCHVVVFLYGYIPIYFYSYVDRQFNSIQSSLQIINWITCELYI